MTRSALRSSLAAVFAAARRAWASGFLYHHFGRSVEGGNNLIVEQIHQPGGGVPRRMAPLILLGTLGHASFRWFSRVVKERRCRWEAASRARFAGCCGWKPPTVRIMLMGGIAAGFGAVFGTPLAGAVFALEVLTIGRVQYEALLPCLIAAIVAGDWTCHAWGIGHTHYAISYLANGRPPGRLLPPGALADAKGRYCLRGFWSRASTFFAELSHRTGNAAFQEA